MKLDMKVDKEMEMLLNEIPHVHHHYHIHDDGVLNGIHGGHGHGMLSPAGDDEFLGPANPRTWNSAEADDGVPWIRELGAMRLDDRRKTPVRSVLGTGDGFCVHKSSALQEPPLFGSGFQQHCLVDANLAHSCLGFHELDSAMQTKGAVGRNPDKTGELHLDSPLCSKFPLSDSAYLVPFPKFCGIDRHWNMNTDRDPYSVMYACLSPRNRKIIEPFGCEDSSMVLDRMKVRRKTQSIADLDGFYGVISPKIHNLLAKSLEYESLMCVKGYIYCIAKDQHGCRFLQHKLDEGKHQIDLIFDGVIWHAGELMVNPFGNYLMQKLLDVCNEEQRMRIVLVLTAQPNLLVQISFNVHGTRAVQKLIESLKTREEIRLVISALSPGFLELIKDLNGNHVIQRCLQSFDVEDNKAIFDAAAIHCIDIGTQRHGCCVLQRCIGYSTGEPRENLVAAISCHGFELAQDAFGNYVVQYVLELKIPTANASLADQFEGKYIHLSMQKFSSNVVEKCLKFFKESDKATIVLELLSVPHFEQLLQHPYANYVIYSALQNSKGSLHTALINAIRPHVELLRTSPYCKRIYSRALLKK